MRMVALFYSISISCRCLCLLKWIQTNKLHQWKSFHFFFFRRIKYPVPLVRCISEWRWIRNSTYTHTNTLTFIPEKKWNYDDRSNFLWFIPYTRSTAEKKLQILQAMHIHELNWELCIDLRFVLCIGMMETAKKTNHKSNNNNNSGHYGDWNK